MIDIALNMAAVTSLYFAISWCLKHQTERDIDEALNMGNGSYVP